MAKDPNEARVEQLYEAGKQDLISFMMLFAKKAMAFRKAYRDEQLSQRDAHKIAGENVSLGASSPKNFPATSQLMSQALDRVFKRAYSAGPAPKPSNTRRNSL